jgi:hypothetical protein
MTTRESLDRLIDELPEVELLALERFAEFLHARTLEGNPLLQFLAGAPVDDEPLTDEDRSAVAASYHAPFEGRVHQQELRRNLGL